MAYNSGTQSGYAANSYLATQQKNTLVAPKPIAKPLKPDGTFTQETLRYLSGLLAAPSDEIAITLGPTPATFQATAKGSVLVYGGTVSAISLTRNGVYNLGVVSGYFPLSIGDILTITYSAAPTCYWFPQ